MLVEGISVNVGVLLRFALQIDVYFFNISHIDAEKLLDFLHLTVIIGKMIQTYSREVSFGTCKVERCIIDLLILKNVFTLV